jgi:hypothetical protein
MRARLSPAVARASLVAVAMTVSGCQVFNPQGCSEEAASIQPLEPSMLSTVALPWPDLATTTTRATLSVGHKPAFGGHYECEARGVVQVPILKVWAALSDPKTTYVVNQDGTSSNIETWQFLHDPASVSSVAFSVDYHTDTHNQIVPVVTFDIVTRLGWLQGSLADPIELGLRSHKTCGTTHIQVMDESIVARPVPPEELPPGVADETAIEMIYWLEADTQGQGDCDDTLRTHWDHASNAEPGGLLNWLETH